MSDRPGRGFRAPPAHSLIAAHGRLIGLAGSIAGIKDPGAVEAALARPLHLLACGTGQETIPQLAVAVAYSICRIRHPFADGNKRVAFAALFGILRMNGLALDASETHAAETIQAVAAGALSEDDFVAWVTAHAYPAVED